MSRKMILGIAVLAIVALVVGAPIHEAFDSHDTKPFPVDPEYIMMGMGSLLAVSLSVALLAAPCLGFAFAVAYALTLWFRPSALSWRSSFDHKRLLFSPPQSTVSLRI
jgi:hypothetical protein